VLAAATRTTATFMRGELPWGRIAPGHRADLLVLAADPLRELATLHDVGGVVLGGRWHPADAATS
jgi:imidazolonepropionase-like amidohydrolase